MYHTLLAGLLLSRGCPWRIAGAVPAFHVLRGVEDGSHTARSAAASRSIGGRTT
jgi:hypothetical protein